MSRPATLSVGRGLTFIALAATAWGTGGAIVAVITRYAGLDPFTISFWRFLIGALALAVVLRLRRGGGRHLDRDRLAGPDMMSGIARRRAVDGDAAVEDQRLETGS